MFVLSQQGNAVFQAVAMFVSLALVFWVLGGPMFAGAANLTYISNTLSDSDLGVKSNHEITFSSPTGVASGETIVVTFPNGFNLSTSSVAVADIDLEFGASEQFLVAAGATSSEWNTVISGQTLTFTSGGAIAVLAAFATATVKIGTNADGPGTQQVTNHSATESYEFVVTAGSGADTGRTRVAIIDNVVVTAAVDTVFDFVINGFAAAGTAVNGTTTSGTSSATSIPFGTLDAGVVATAMQNLTVGTNAIHGFVVTLEQDANLLSATGADIDGFAMGAYTNTPSGWFGAQAIVTDIADEDTWGHWGITSTDDLNSDEFFYCTASSTYGCWVAASTTPRDVFSHDGPADSVTNDIGSTTIGFQVEISALQEAADDYQTTLTYIATPTF